MKKLYFLPLLFLAFTGFAQKQIVVQNSTAQTFNDLNAAIAAASAGDTLYIPGGGFSVAAPVDKTLHWRGVGHYPDSTIATGHTQITNTVTFTGNCDNSTFEGIFFQYGANFGSAGNEATGIRIKYCRVDGTLNMRYNTDISGGNPDLNFKISESIITNINAYLGTNVRMEQNLIFGIAINFFQCLFINNSFNVSNSSSVFRDCDFCQFTNNVFSYHHGIDGNCSNCNFTNNIFQAALPYNPTTSSHTGSGNLYSVGVPNTYVAITGYVYQFSYENDYHLNPASTGTAEDGTTGVSIIGTGTDGFDAGIYGTTLPYKDGAVPYAPHIRTATIDNEAVSGNLGVKITVAAQER